MINFAISLSLPVRCPIFVLLVVLIIVMVSIFLPFGKSFDQPYHDKLTKLYNDTQGNTDEYLDKVHSQFLCCGVTGMKLNVIGDPNLFEPDKGVLTRLPKSWCSVLDANDQCVFTNIYQTPGDLKHFQKVHTFNWFAVPVLILSIIWKIVFHFAYKNGSDSLFYKMLNSRLIQTVQA